MPDNSPIYQPVPADPTERVHRFARDLAWGALNNRWSSLITSVQSEPNIYYWVEARKVDLAEYVEVVWGDQPPLGDLLASFGYLNIIRQNGSDSTDYLITQKAFDLLREPATPPSVFISYRRAESSAFGLLILARLKMVGVINPFLDMQIEPGADWYAHLEKIVRGSRYFILLIGRTSLESDYVQQELTWALDTPDCTIIPVWHNGFAGGAAYPAALAARQTIEVKRESAEEYELAVIKILNRLGYTP
jgi:hypothetical protein